MIIGTDGSVAVVTIADMRHDWLPSLLDAAPAAQRLAAALMAPPAAERRPPRPPTRLPARADWLHGLVAKLYPGDLEVVHNESWSPIGGGRVRGQVSVAARGAPGSGRGAAVLAPAQNGSRLKCTVTVDFKVPLLGGKIESFIGRQIVEQIAVVQHFTTKWITEHA